MQRVDAHQHFWQLARGDYAWLRPDRVTLRPLLRDFAPADLRPALHSHGVVATVLVQAAASTAETDFLLELAAAHDWIGAVVGWVDLSEPASIDTLQRWARQPKFKGIRPMLQDLPDPDWIAHAPHPDVMRAVLELGLSFDALVKPAQLAALLRFVQRHPQLPVVVDHAAKPPLGDAADDAAFAAWRRDLSALAAQPQVLCKLSGLLTEAGATRELPLDSVVARLRPVWDELLRGFGVQRLMWGSDWPVLNLAADYARWVAVSDALVADLAPADQHAIRSTNAARFYALTL